jgi:hypothetical protein
LARDSKDGEKVIYINRKWCFPSDNHASLPG